MQPYLEYTANYRRSKQECVATHETNPEIYVRSHMHATVTHADILHRSLRLSWITSLHAKQLGERP